MKKPFFPLNKFFPPADKALLFPALLWVLLHAGLPAALGFSVLFGGPVKISAGFFDILPASRFPKSIAAADRFLADRTGRHVYILAESADFNTAKRGAEEFYALFAGASGESGDAVFEDISLYTDENVLAEFSDFLFDYRYALLDGSTRELLENGGVGDIAGDALAQAYGAVNFTSLDRLDRDPFFLVDRQIKNTLFPALLSGGRGSLSLRDDVLAVQNEGNWYVLIRGTLAPGGVALTNKDSAVEKIYAVRDLIREKTGGLEFMFSGVPFHSYESSSGAQREISLITTVTLAIVIFLFFLAFRSLIPVLVSVSATLVSIASALGAALLFFREVHILTLVFGTTLIGTCVDYSIHFFIFWKRGEDLKTGREVRARILRSVSLSCVSTLVCFAALLFAPFTILKQFAVFSLAGLFSSFLSVTCLYPLLKKEKRKKENRPGLRTGKAVRAVPPAGLWLPKKICLLSLPVLSLILLFVNRERVRIENNIAGLYTMSASLLESEKTSARILNQGSPGWYFIVSGSTPEETLEHEEALRSALDAEKARGNLGSLLAVSAFIPSAGRQKQNYEAAGRLLPLADSQFEALGFPPEAAGEFRRDFAAAEGTYLVPGDRIPGPLRELVSNLWIGRVPGTGRYGEPEGYYSCVLPLGVTDEAPFRGAAEKSSHVFFVNKVKDIGDELDALTKNMILLFLAAYAVIVLLVKYFYSWRRTLRICAVPFLLVLVTLAVLACADIPLGFFSMVGLVLVFGLGLDYMFYVTEHEKSAVSGNGETENGFSLALLAILLSFVTTALSFGALALSTFTPVHIFGLTVFSGLSTAYISAMLLTGSVSSENQRKQGSGKTAFPPPSSETAST
jgi:predicted exporter